MKHQIDFISSSALLVNTLALIRFCMAARHRLTAALPSRSATGITWLAAVFLFFSTGSAFTQTLTHRYSFTGGSSVTSAIDSVGAADGAFVGNAQVQSNALVLDGFSYVSLPAGVIDSSYTNGLSIEIWANLTPTLDGQEVDLFAFGNTNGDDNYLGITTHDTGNNAEIDITTNGAGGEIFGNQPGPVSGNVHLAGVWDATNGIMTWYVNGNLWCSNVFFPAMMDDVIGSSNQISDLGAQINGSGGVLGTIDEFRIYNGTLTLAQIRASIAAGPDFASPLNFGAITNVSVSVNSIFIVGTWEDPVVLANSLLVSNMNLTTAPQVTFTSGDTNILLALPSGQVQAVGPGTTTLTATYQGVHGQATVTTMAAPAHAVMTHRYSFTSDASDSISGENGVLMGEAAVNTAAAPHALDLTSNVLTSYRGSFLNLPRDVIDGYPAVTLEYWVSMGNNSDFCRLFSSGSFFPAGSDSSAFILSPYWGNPSDSIVLLLNPQVGTDAGDQHAVIPGDVDNAGEVQIVGVCDPVTAQVLELYTNGVLAASTSTSYSLLIVTNQHVVVGKSLGTYDPFVNGTVDEIRIYYGALSGGQIAADFLAGPDSTNGSPGALQSISATFPTNMTVGQITNVTVDADYANVSNVVATLSATITSSNTAVLSVGAGGLITAVGPGTATLSATLLGLTVNQLVTVVLPPPAMLMDRYSFTTDASDSVGTNDGILFGDATVANGALVLDGSAYVGLPAGTITPSYNVLTMELFANVQRTADGTPTVIAYFGNSAGSSYCRMVTKANSCNCWIGYAADGNGEFRVWPPGPIAGNVHLVAVWNPLNGYMLFYKNGILVGSNSIPEGLPLADMDGTNDQQSLIGANVGGGIPPTGTIDEFRIYSGELTIDQIRASLAAGPTNIPLVDGTINPGAITSVSVSVHADFIAGTVADPIVTANTPTVTNINLTQVPDVTFTSGNTNVLLVLDNGQIQAVGQGTTTLTATYQGVSSPQTSVMVIPVPEQPQLTHRYSFTGDASDSISGENGVLLGGADITSNALDLTGNGPSGLAGGTSGAYLGLPRDVITGYPAVTVEMWVNLGPDAGGSRLLYDGSSDNPGDTSAFILSPSWNGNTTELILNPQVGIDPGNEQAVLGELLAGLGEVQIVGVASPSVLQLYLNGSLVASSPNSYSLVSVSNQFVTVGQATDDNPYVNGTIDELRLYYGALSAGQIAADARLGPNGVAPPLTVALSGQSLLISWPAASTGFTLQSSPALGGAAENWRPVSGSPTANGAYLTMTVSISAGPQFFRLVN
jgi:hypothetical protein